MTVIKNIKYAENSERNVFDIYLPDCEEFDVLIYFHGGGLEGGEKEHMTALAENLVKKGIAVATPNYRLYPNAVYPEFTLDAAEAVNFIFKNAGMYGKVKKIYIGGSSAGAYLTAMLAFDSAYLKKHSIKTKDIAGYIINSAQMTTHFNVLRERGLDTRRIIVDEAAPVYHITENSDFPNMLIFTADNDMPCRYEQNLMFIRTLRHFGCPEDKINFVIMENSSHCSYDKEEKYTDLLANFIN